MSKNAENNLNAIKDFILNETEVGKLFTSFDKQKWSETPFLYFLTSLFEKRQSYKVNVILIKKIDKKCKY